MEITTVANTKQLPSGKKFRLIQRNDKDEKKVIAQLQDIEKRFGMTFGTIYQFAGVYFYAAIEGKRSAEREE
jgi:hypothetical protein